ncbi:MAG: MarR family winged helix-turn-helix transcriptional regulator [Ilumatobacteraceae bacterium]
MSKRSADSPLTIADYQSLARFRYALRTFLRFTEQSARDAGLTPAQHQLLLAVKGYPGDGPTPLANVADMLQLKLHSAGELADRAVANGLVTRLVDPDDRRRVLVELTVQGEHRLRELTVLHRDELRRFEQEMNAVLRELDR